MKDISRELVASLLPMERALGNTNVQNISVLDYLKAIREVNEALAARVKEQRSVLDGEVIARLHERLAGHVGSESPGSFDDTGRDKSWPWSRLVREIMGDVEDEATVRMIVAHGGYVHIVVTLATGGHLPDFGLTIGWLVMNGFIHQGGASPIVAPEEQAADWARGIEAAVTDTEGLRANLMRL